jgi:hypothetical protein
MKTLGIIISIIIGILMIIPCFIISVDFLKINKELSLWFIIVIIQIEILGIFITPIKFFKWFKSNIK